MKITAFEGNKGDCVLLTSAGGKNILIDGGHVTTHRPTDVNSYKDNVAPSLGQMRADGDEIDLICVSHVDQDHIGGILILLDDEFAWRVFDHQTGQGLNPDPPANPRPPRIGGIWHNAFHEQLNRNRGEITDALAAGERRSLALGIGPTAHGGNLFEHLANSMREATLVSRRIGQRQLNIPLNPEFGGKLVLREDTTTPVAIGDLRVSVLGPTPERLEELRDEWNKWLKSAKGKGQLQRIHTQSREAEEALIQGNLDIFLKAINLGPAVGDRSSVTEENVASIVMMVEENCKTVLMTGDARDDHIVEDLVATGFADTDGHAHVNVLKLQHHGSENNFSREFGRKVTADHYLICGNGKHENPDLRVLERLIASRIGDLSERSPNPQTGQSFKLWLTSDGTTHKADKHHMQEVKKLVSRAQRTTNGQMTSHFNSGALLNFEI